MALVTADSNVINLISQYLDVKLNSVKRIYRGEGELLEFVIIR